MLPSADVASFYLILPEKELGWSQTWCSKPFFSPVDKDSCSPHPQIPLVSWHDAGLGLHTPETGAVVTTLAV